MTAWCAITDLGNRPDENGRGCVPYAYDVAKYQVTNAEWAAFLNAVGSGEVERHRLYHKDMTSGILGGVLWGPDGYSPKAGWEKKPVVYVNYESLCRYCNWLMTGDVERGCYDLTTCPPRRLKGARYFLLTDDEWYKAAYYDQGAYRLYPTGCELPRLDQANFERGDDFSKGPPHYLADVDEYAESCSPWGVVQMGGNAWEFLETVRRRSSSLDNLLRGGSFGYTETGLSKANVDVGKYNGRCYVFGARIGHCASGWRPTPKPFRYRAHGVVAAGRDWLRRIWARLRGSRGRR